MILNIGVFTKQLSTWVQVAAKQISSQRVNPFDEFIDRLIE